MQSGGATRMDIWSYDVQSRTAAPLLASAFDEGWATFSPDGKWIAYVSDENQQRAGLRPIVPRRRCQNANINERRCPAAMASRRA